MVVNVVVRWGPGDGVCTRVQGVQGAVQGGHIEKSMQLHGHACTYRFTLCAFHTTLTAYLLTTN